MQDPIFNGNLGNVKSSWKSWPTANIHFGDLSRLGNWSNTSQVAPRRSQWSLAGCEDTSQMDIIWMGFLDSGFNNHTSLMPNKGLNSFLKLKCWCFLIMLAMSSAHDLVLQHGASCCFTLLCLLYTTLPINHLYVPNAQENSISKAKRPSVRYVFFFIAVTVQGFGRMVCDFLRSFIFQVYRQLLLLVRVYHWICIHKDECFLIKVGDKW